MVWYTVQDMEDAKRTMMDCQATDLRSDLPAPTAGKSYKIKIKNKLIEKDIRFVVI